MARLLISRIWLVLLWSVIAAACSSSATPIPSALPTTPSINEATPSLSAPTASATASPSPAPLANVTEFSVGMRSDHYYVVAVRADGTVSTTNAAPAVLKSLTNVTSVAVGADHVLVLYGDGTVTEWGTDGTSVTPPATATGVKSITWLAGLVSAGSGSWAGSDGFAAIRDDGSVVAWGTDCVGPVTLPKGLAGVTAIVRWNDFDPHAAVIKCTASGLALHANGTVTGWGTHSFGNTSGTSNSVARWAGQFNHATAIGQGGLDVFAVADSGQVVWQSGEAGGKAAIANVTHLYLTQCYGLALRADGTVTGWSGGACIGNEAADKAAITPPADLAGVIEAWTGNDASAALLSDGSLVTWGDTPPFALPTAP